MSCNELIGDGEYLFVGGLVLIQLLLIALLIRYWWTGRHITSSNGWHDTAPLKPT